MKFAVAYYLLLIYATVIVKPIVPLAKDVLLHCFAKAYHEATVHATEGKNHVEKEMAASGKSDDAKNQKTDKTEQTLHEASSETISLLNPVGILYKYAFLNESASHIFIAFDNPPPRISICCS